MLALCEQLQGQQPFEERPSPSTATGHLAGSLNAKREPNVASLNAAR